MLPIVLLLLATIWQQSLGKSNSVMMGVVSEETKEDIVHFHNMIRRKVFPEASNMLKMKWNQKASENAKKWVATCEERISDISIRTVNGEAGIHLPSVQAGGPARGEVEVPEGRKSSPGLPGAAPLGITRDLVFGITRDFKALGKKFRDLKAQVAFSSILPVQGCGPGRDRKVSEENDWLRVWCQKEHFRFLDHGTRFLANGLLARDKLYLTRMGKRSFGDALPSFVWKT
ncbi:Cysteine-rich venom protein [Varanus komodoensis]|nr:Cysteine-rich venom protein [Varanus komodoensis]